MNKNIAIVVILSNLIFYIGIFFTIILFMTDDNTPKWLFAILCVIVGVIGSAIPDSMINIGIVKLNINIVRVSLLIKYLIFIVCFSILDVATTVTIIGICIFFVVDVFVEYLLIKSIYSKHITMIIFMENLKCCDTTPINGIVKYLIYNFVCILFFANIHENIIEVTIMLIVCISVHVFVSEKIIKKLSIESRMKKNKMRVVLWSLEMIMCIFAYYDKTMAICIIFANYYTVVTDLIMPRKTSIFKKK